MPSNPKTEFIIGAKNATKKAFDEVNKQLGDMNTKAARVGASIAGALSVGAFKGFLDGTSRTLLEMNQMAQVSNTTVQEFQGLAFGARSVGIEQEKLGDIFKDVQDKVGDFINTGGGELKDFFTNIAPQVGVTAAEFRNLSGPEALQLYVSSLEKANLSQSEMTFYLEAIANDASRLLPLLRNNGEGFAQLSRQAQEMGLILSGDAVQGSRDLTASITTLGAVSDNYQQRVAIALAPTIRELTGLLVDYGKQTGTAAEQTSVLGSGLKVVTSVGVAISGMFQAAGKSLGALAAGVAALARGDLAGAREAFAGSINDPIEEYRKTVDRLVKLWNGEYAAAGAKVVDVQTQLNASYERSKQSVASYAKVTQDNLSKVRTAQTAVAQGLQEAISKQTSLENEATNKIKALKEQQLEVYKKYRDRLKEFAAAGPQEEASTYSAAADLKVKARAAAAKGDVQATSDLAEQAYEVLQRLKAAGGSTFGLQGFIKELQQIEVSANQNAQGALQQKVTNYQAQIDKLKADLAAVKAVKVDVILDDTKLAAVQAQLKTLAEQLKTQFQIPVTLAVSDTGTAAAPAGKSAPGFAGGGHVRGPGTGTSDSILARLSDGEFVLNAAAVKHYGVGALQRLNGMQMPRFAEGGLASAADVATGASGRPVHLAIPGYGDVPLTGAASVVEGLEKHFRITALQKGATKRRGRAG